MRRAFTLLELLLVLVVLGVVTAVAAARLNGLRGTQALEQCARRFSDQVLRSQELSTRLGQAVRLRLDLGAVTCTVQILSGTTTTDPVDGQDAKLDLRDGADSLTLTYRATSGQAADGTQVDLLFLPDGVCDLPGVLVLDDGRQALALRCYRLARLPTWLNERPVASAEIEPLLVAGGG
jgi:type II secretion system protein H